MGKEVLDSVLIQRLCPSSHSITPSCAKSPYFYSKPIIDSGRNFFTKNSPASHAVYSVFRFLDNF